MQLRNTDNKSWWCVQSSWYALVIQPESKMIIAIEEIN